MIHVWMDPPYSDLINDFLSDKNFTEGDISSRKAIRVRNQCKPYQHFVDVIKTFSDVYFPIRPLRKGSIRNKGTGKCLDIATTPEHKKSIILYQCHKKISTNQFFIHTKNKQIRADGSAVLRVIQESRNETSVGVLVQCEDWPTPVTVWTYDVHSGSLQNALTNLCLTATRSDSLELKDCTGENKQFWEWGIVESVQKT